MNRLITCAVLGASLLAATRSAAGQTLFAPLPTPAALGRYTSPGQCLAAARRIQDSVWRGQRRDTIPYDPQEPAPAAAAEASRRCGARFAVEAADPRDWPTLLRLLLVMGDTAAAEQVAERRAAAAADSTERAEVLYDAVTACLEARPAHLAMARRLVARIDTLVPTALVARLAGYNRLLDAARAGLDTATMRYAATSWFARYATAPDSLRHSVALFHALAMTRDLVFLDGGARLDTEEWIRRIRDESRRRVGPGWESFLKIGRPAPPLAGDFWFGRQDSAEVRPAPGRWSLLVFVDHPCEEQCYPAYAVLRRLQRRMGPALDITLIAQTRGYFRLQPPPTPPEEVEMVRHQFLDELELPGVLSVTVTPFLRRPDPDRRRVDRNIPNRTNYGYSGGKSPQSLYDFQGAESRYSADAVLVDPRGRVVYEVSLDPQQEAMLYFVLRTMLGPQERGA